MKSNILKHLSRLLSCLAAMAVFASCSDDHTGSVDISGECLVQKLVLNDKFEATVSIENRLLKVKVPVGFDQKSDMTVTALTVSPGAKTNIQVGDHINFDADKTLRVSNGDLVMDYRIAVRNDEAKLKLFLLEGVKGAINEEEKTVSVSMMSSESIDLTNATFDAECSEDATIYPASGTKGNFTEPFTITVTDNTATATYTVYVKLINDPEALFVGEADNIEGLNPEEKAAAKWLTGNIDGAAYASWDAVASGAISLERCKLIFFHPLPRMREFWQKGGAFILGRSAVNYAIALGAMPEDAYPNNVWGGGGGEGSDLMEDDPWHFYAYDAAHPLWQNLNQYPGAPANAVYTLDKGYTICNTTSQFALWNPYTGQEAFESITGARALSHGGDGAVVAWELKAASGNFGKGGIICFGSGLFDWNSPTEYVPLYHENMGKIMLNAYSYLTK